MFFFFQAEDGIRDDLVTGVQTCALPIYGWTGSTIAGFSSPLETSRPPRLKPPTMPARRNRLSPRDSNQLASGVPGAVQSRATRLALEQLQKLPELDWSLLAPSPTL